MRLTLDEKNNIKLSFERMQTKQDLLNLLNCTKSIIYGSKYIPFELRQLNYHSHPRVNAKRYKQFTVKKKSGGERTIYAPTSGLKAIQTCLNVILQAVFTPNPAATGFQRGRSILDNAKLHSGNYYVYNIDLKDFFHSVDQARVWSCFQLRPFNLTDEKQTTIKLGDDVRTGSGTYRTEREVLNFDIRKGGLLVIRAREKAKFSDEQPFFVFSSHKELSPKWEKSIQVAMDTFLMSSRQKLASMLASLCCTEIEVERQNSFGEWELQKKNVLPQGAPTSPIVTNIVCQRLDFLLLGAAKKFGLKYSRYADDITFSSLHNVYQVGSSFVQELQRIIRAEGFEINNSKTRLQREGYRQEVTGLTVNHLPNVSARYIKQLRMWIYYLEKYGFERADSYFVANYLKDRGHIAKGRPNILNVIGGKLEFLKMIKGETNSTEVLPFHWTANG